MSLLLIVNGQNKEFQHLAPPTTLAEVIADLALKGDRVAVELNGSIVERKLWAATKMASGDRLEIVHFVGGGSIA